jgi:hypothetical protein
VLMRSPLAQRCCRTDTLPTSLSNLSRRRQTRGLHPCFVVAWLMLVLRKRSAPRWPGALPHTPLRAPGPAATATEVPGPHAEGRDRTFPTRPHPPTRGTTKGTGVASGSLPRGTARSKDYAWPIRHSVGRKAALNWNIAESVANRTLGLKVIRPGPRPIREGT